MKVVIQLQNSTKTHTYVYIYICRSRKSNLVEFQILPVESPIGVSANINLLESPIGVSTGRTSNQGDLGIVRTQSHRILQASHFCKIWIFKG